MDHGMGGFRSPSPMALPDLERRPSFDETMFPAAHSNVPLVPLTPPPAETADSVEKESARPPLTISVEDNDDKIDPAAASPNGSFRHPALSHVSAQTASALSAARARRPSMIIARLSTDDDDCTLPYTPKAESSSRLQRGGSGNSLPDFGRLYKSEDEEEDGDHSHTHTHRTQAKGDAHRHSSETRKPKVSKKTQRLNEETETLATFRLVQNKRKSVSDLMAFMNDPNASLNYSTHSHSHSQTPSSVGGDSPPSVSHRKTPHKSENGSGSVQHTSSRSSHKSSSQHSRTISTPATSQKTPRISTLKSSKSQASTLSLSQSVTSMVVESPAAPTQVIKIRRDRGFRSINTPLPPPREDTLDPSDRLGLIVAKYIDAIDRFIRSRTNFYAPGYFYPIGKLFENVPPPKALKIADIPMFVKFLRFNDDEFQLSSNKKAVELLHYTPCRRENQRCYGHFHCVNQYCDTRWESDASYACEFQVCERCYTQVYPYRQDVLPADYVGPQDAVQPFEEPETPTAMQSGLLHVEDHVLGDLVDYVVDDFVEESEKESPTVTRSSTLSPCVSKSECAEL